MQKRKSIFLIVTLIQMLTFILTPAVLHPAFAAESKGFLIVTREMFVQTLEPFIQWKQFNGFNVNVVTAEWIDENIPGADVRIKIRNCLRQYHYDNSVEYVMLVGDSLDIIEPGNETQPTPLLTEDWNMPAGYYWWNLSTSEGTPFGAQYTSIYYSDLSDKLSYNETEFLYSGDYKIYIGVVPVRTINELQTYLSKTINYKVSSTATFMVSNDTSDSNYEEVLEEISSLMQTNNVSTSLYFFDDESSSNDIHETLFNREGFLYESGHGNLQILKMGDVYLTNDNASDFQFINPSLVTWSCVVQAYHIGESLDEAFIKAHKGPVTILAGLPQGPITLPGDLSVCEYGFWTDILSGKSVGQSFYDNCNQSWMNPLTLFGDPSLTVFGSPTPSLVINGGEAFTSSTSVVLSFIPGNPLAGVNEIRYSNDGVWDTESWEDLSQSRSWTLSPGEGIKVVYYQTKDSSGEISDTYLSSIILNTVIPESPWTILLLLLAVTLLMITSKNKLLNWNSMQAAGTD
jgi:hypothetical protein